MNCRVSLIYQCYLNVIDVIDNGHVSELCRHNEQYCIYEHEIYMYISINQREISSSGKRQLTNILLKHEILYMLTNQIRKTQFQ